MNTGNIKIILMGFGVAIILFAVLGVFPLLGQIEKESHRFISNKKERADLEFRAENLVGAEAILPDYPLVGLIDPFDFIDFLEKEAESSGLSVRIDGDYSEEPWSASNFKLKELSGSSAGFSSFLEKIESADYLIQITEFKILKGEENMIKGSLSGKVYGKVF